MPTSVAEAFAAACLQAHGVVRWGTPIPEGGPGVYAVALTHDPNDSESSHPECPLALDRVAELLAIRPELRIDGERPDVDELAARLASLWLPDENIVYIGLAGGSLTRRVGDYYATPLGARRPHAGGWPLKTLAVLDKLSVHYATCDSVKQAERAMVDAFLGGVSASARESVCDPQLPLPFANLQLPSGPRKRHGITGARESTASSAPTRSTSHKPRAPVTAELPAVLAHEASENERTQRVTAKDINAGQIRVPAATKRLLPAERAEVELRLHGRPLTARWDPRTGPDRSRSGVLRFGRGTLDSLVQQDERLNVSIAGSGLIELA